MLKYAPANLILPTIFRPHLGQAATVPVLEPNKVPAGKWFLNFGILTAGLVMGYIGINNHKKPLGILAIQAGGSIVGAALVFLAMDAAYPQHPQASNNHIST